MPPKPPVEHLELGLFGHARPMVTVQDVAEKFIVNDDQVRIWIDEGWLLKMPIGAADSLKRQHVRIVRYSADALYVFRMEESNGVQPPYKLTPEAQWWLEQCRERRKKGERLRG